MNINDFEIFKQNSYRKFVNDGREFLINQEPYLDIVLTDYCHANCKFCIGNLVHKRVKIDLEVLKEKVKFAVDNMGVKEVLLLGGEPTMSPILYDVIQFLKTLSLNKIIMTTNGVILSLDQKFREKILSSGLTNINVSFMNLDSQKQHEIVHSPYTLTQDGIEEIYNCARENGVKVRINNNIFKDNNDSLHDMEYFHTMLENYCDSIKFSPLLRTDLFSVVPIKTEWVKENILSDEKYDELFSQLETRFSNFYRISIITNENQFGFVKNSMIPLKTPIILNWNQHGHMMQRVIEENKINNIKLLSIGELSLSWNRESYQYFIKTNGGK